MASTLDRFDADISKLQTRGQGMLVDLAAQIGKEKPEGKEKPQGNTFVFARDYQSWYSEAHELIRQLLPSRLDDFELLYHDTKRAKHSHETYGIREWLLGSRSGRDHYGERHFNDLGTVIMKFQNQISIVSSCNARLKSSIFQLRSLVQADLFDSELDAGRELVKNGFFRAAGAVAGVVIEHHLAEVCRSRKVVLKTKNPTISTLNDALKDAEIIDVPTWRFIQRLGDLRNLCDHKKSVEPTKDDVTELIAGTEKITKTIA